MACLRAPTGLALTHSCLNFYVSLIHSQDKGGLWGLVRAMYATSPWGETEAHRGETYQGLTLVRWSESSLGLLPLNLWLDHVLGVDVTSGEPHSPAEGRACLNIKFRH